MRNQVTTILGHLAGIAFFLTMPIVFSPEQQMGDRLQRELFGYLLIVCFFYLNYTVLIPAFYFKKKYFCFIVCILACYIFVTFLPQYIFPFTDRFHERPGPGSAPGFDSSPFSPAGHSGSELLRHVGHTIFLFFLVVFVSLAMRINGKWKETEKEKLTTELSLLKAQVNPHFLFNTLNSIYSLAIVQSTDTANAIVKLSGLMRYVLHDAKQNFVSLQRELDCIRDYIDLQQIRWGDSLDVCYQIVGDASGKSIAPVVLQPFIENAFKHGVSTEEEAKIEINIQIVHDQLHMQVVNDKVRAANLHEAPSGLGIENTRLRLNMMYPSAYTLNITEDAHKFRVDLTLQLKNKAT